MEQPSGSQQQQEEQQPSSSQQQPVSSQQQRQQARRSRAAGWLTNTLAEAVPEAPAWEVTDVPAAKKSRVITGWRRPSQAQQAADAAAASVAADDVDGDWDWPGLEGFAADSASPAPAAASGGNGFVEQAACIRDPRAADRSAEQQLKWDIVRPQMQRSYVEHLAAAHSLARDRIAAERSLLEGRLAAQTPQCPCCGSSNMQLLQPVEVLYIGTELRFLLQAPVHSCCAEGCSGTFAPSPFSIGCFPLTAKVSWDIAQASPAQPARWADLRLLQLCDSMIFGGGRSASVHSLVAAIHRCH